MHAPPASARVLHPENKINQVQPRE